MVDEKEILLDNLSINKIENSWDKYEYNIFKYY